MLKFWKSKPKNMQRKKKWVPKNKIFDSNGTPCNTAPDTKIHLGNSLVFFFTMSAPQNHCTPSLFFLGLRYSFIIFLNKSFGGE